MGETSGKAPPGQIERNLDVSVVIPTRNSARTIAVCIKSVIEQRPREIVAVDARSSDETRNILKQHHVKILRSPLDSVGFARRLGVEHATRGLVMFLDSDAVLGRDCIRTLRSELLENGWAGIHPHVLSLENNTYWQKSEDQRRRLFFNRTGPKSTIPTMAALFRRELVLSHPFDPYMRTGEDSDLCQRLARDEVVGISSARAVVYHLHRRELSEFAGQRFNYGRYGGARCFKKYRLNEILPSPFASLYYAFYCALRYRKLRLVPYWLVNCLCTFVGLAVGLSARSSDGGDSLNSTQND